MYTFISVQKYCFSLFLTISIYFSVLLCGISDVTPIIALTRVAEVKYSEFSFQVSLYTACFYDAL